MAATSAEDDAVKSNDDILSVFEKVGSRLNEVEKEIEEGGAVGDNAANRNRRRRHQDERDGRQVISVKEEMNSLKDELHSLRRQATRARGARPRSLAGTLFKVLILAAVAVLAYLYWFRLLHPLSMPHWGSSDGAEVEGAAEESFLERVHFGFKKSVRGSEKGAGGGAGKVSEGGATQATEEVANKDAGAAVGGGQVKEEGGTAAKEAKGDTSAKAAGKRKARKLLNGTLRRARLLRR